MPRYQKISRALYKQLQGISPSLDWSGFLDYYPCEVILTNGRTVDCVYIVQEDSYIKVWGVFPEEDSGKQSIQIEDVNEIHDSPSRLPAKFANIIYKAGESGMGYCIFTVEFSDGESQTYLTGNAVDFVKYPSGKDKFGISNVLPHTGYGKKDMQQGRDYYWCIYSGVED